MNHQKLRTKSTQTTVGRVWLVGAGPGDPGLLTIRAAQIIATADVIVFDRLINEQILNLARPEAARIYVGKAASQHAVPQDEINQILVDQAKSGKNVCRLKGGDPFVFGRGGEEASYLQQFEIPCEIISGVTSAVAVPASVGIPVTDRRCASSFAVITGHEEEGKAESAIQWKHLASAVDTLVFLMGRNNLAAISSQLIAHGRPADTPAAIIERGCTPAQRIINGNLQTLPTKAEEAKVESPAIIVVGKVVGLQNQILNTKFLPLQGKKILVTRPRHSSETLTAPLLALGATPIILPAIELESIDAPCDLLSRLATAHWIVFTSANGVAFLLAQLRRLGKDVRALGTAKIACIGPATAKAVQNSGLNVDFIPESYVAECLATTLPLQKSDRICIPRAAEAREILVEMLQQRGSLVDVIPVYRTVSSTEEVSIPAELDFITFTSPSTVKHFVAKYRQRCERATLACIGPITAAAVREVGLHPSIIASQYTSEGLIQAIIEWESKR